MLKRPPEPGRSRRRGAPDAAVTPMEELHASSPSRPARPNRTPRAEAIRARNRAGWTSLVVAAAVLAGKLAVFYITGSVAVYADALESIGAVARVGEGLGCDRTDSGAGANTDCNSRDASPMPTVPP